MTRKIVKELAEGIVDNGEKYRRVIQQLGNGKTLDYCEFDRNGKPREVTYLEMVKVGITGLSLSDVKEILSA